MNEHILRSQVTARQMKLLVEALEDLTIQLPKNPKLFALMTEAPLDHIARMCVELDQHLTEIKQLAGVPALQDEAIQALTHFSGVHSQGAPGPIESAS